MLVTDRPQGTPIAGYLLDAHDGPDSTLAAYHPAMFLRWGIGIGSTGTGRHGATACQQTNIEEGVEGSDGQSLHFHRLRIAYACLKGKGWFSIVRNCVSMS